MELADTVVLESDGNPEGMTRHETDLSTGTIEYADSGGEGPVIVLLHGLLMDASLREDRVMPLEHGRRLAELLPHGRLVDVSDSYTLIPQDQPASLAQIIREFMREPGISALSSGRAA